LPLGLPPDGQRTEILAVFFPIAMTCVSITKGDKDTYTIPEGIEFGMSLLVKKKSIAIFLYFVNFVDIYA
jgi:hypothetical protein